MQGAFKDLGMLLKFLELDPQTAPYSLDFDPTFPLLAPRSFAERIRKGDWQDPLLLQILPRGAERESKVGFSGDPVSEREAEKIPGLLHKYPGRVLLMPTEHCAIHCRYCFRREFPYGNLPKQRDNWDEAYAYISERPEIEEVIFSGGDPLMLSNAKLAWHWERAVQIPHVRIIRFHTRVPVVLPTRIDDGFIALAESHSLKTETILVIHSNHAAEISPEVGNVLRRLRCAGLQLLHQGVALRDINSDFEVLQKHWKTLAQSGMTPYYHHLLDPVAGAWHFDVPQEEAMETHRLASRSLSGHSIPRLVREIPFREGKVQVMMERD
jgi:EF-P beta-lysylation protein EpmB